MLVVVSTNADDSEIDPGIGFERVGPTQNQEPGWSGGPRPILESVQPVFRSRFFTASDQMTAPPS